MSKPKSPANATGPISDELDESKRNPKIERAALSVLRTNSEQPEVYDDCSDSENAQLADDIRVRGLDRLIEVVPVLEDGKVIYRIVDGHRRWKALKDLGWHEADVYVRWDLYGATETDIQLAFVSANLVRRQLDTVQRVRAAIRKYELLHNDGDQLSGYAIQRARDQIGALIGVSGRTISRYLRLARTPLLVQQAVSRGSLRLTDGEKVDDLRPSIQASLAAELTASSPETHAEIVRRYLAECSQRARRRQPHPMNRIFKWLAAQEPLLEPLEAVGSAIHGPSMAKHAETLRRLQKLIGEWIVASSKPGGDLKAEFQHLMNKH